jgi:hypothetical protein
MGTGSLGGGSGGYGGGGGAREPDGWGEYNFPAGGGYLSPVISANDVRLIIQKTISGMSKDYIKLMFGSRIARSIFEEVFQFNDCLNTNNPLETVLKLYAIPDGPGYLVRWIYRIMEQYKSQEPVEKVRRTVKVCLDDFFIRALNDDIQLFSNGTLKDVLKNIDSGVFKSTSGYFLGFFVWNLLLREFGNLAEEIQSTLHLQAQKLADKIILDFEQNYLAKNGNHYRDLFRIIQEEPDWFRKELRQ